MLKFVCISVEQNHAVPIPSVENSSQLLVVPQSRVTIASCEAESETARGHQLDGESALSGDVVVGVGFQEMLVRPQQDQILVCERLCGLGSLADKAVAHPSEGRDGGLSGRDLGGQLVHLEFNSVNR